MTGIQLVEFRRYVDECGDEVIEYETLQQKHKRLIEETFKEHMREQVVQMNQDIARDMCAALNERYMELGITQGGPCCGWQSIGTVRESGFKEDI